MKNLSHQAAFSSLGVLTQGLSRFAYSIIVGRALGIEALAAVNSALALTMVVVLLWPTGLGNTAAQALATAQAQGRGIAKVLQTVKRSFFVSAPFIVMIAIVFEFAGTPNSWPFALSVVLLALSYSGYLVMRSMQMALGGASRAALWDTITGVASITGLVVVLVLGMPQWVLLPMALSFVAFAVQAVWFVEEALGGHGSRADFVQADFLRATGWNSASLIAANGIVQLAMIAVYMGASPGIAGISPQRCRWQRHLQCLPKQFLRRSYRG